MRCSGERDPLTWFRIASVTSIGTRSLAMVVDRYRRKSWKTKPTTPHRSSSASLPSLQVEYGVPTDDGNKYSHTSPSALFVLGMSARFSLIRLGNTCSRLFLVSAGGIVIVSSVMYAHLSAPTSPRLIPV